MSSDAQTADVRRLDDDGMITLRADLADASVQDALARAGLGMPDQRGLIAAPSAGVAWMSPDELLILCAPGVVAELCAKIAEAFGSLHHLSVPVSDARARFRISGPGADGVLAQLCPVDIATFPIGEVRRSRLAQIPAAFWRDGADALMVICFRSVADYAQGILENAAQQAGSVRLP